MIAIEMYNMNTKLNNELNTIKAIVYERALLHDIEECVIGDIPRIDSVRSVANELKSRAIKSIDQFVYDNQYNFGQIRKVSKRGIAGLIVEYFEYCALFAECIREMNLGNKHVIQIAERALYLMVMVFENDELDFLDSWIDNVIKDYLKSHKDGVIGYALID